MRILILAALLLGAFPKAGFSATTIGITLSTITWLPGAIGSFAVLESTKITVTNTGSIWEEINVKSANSGNWNLVTNVTGQNEFSLRIKGGDLASYQYLAVTYLTLTAWMQSGGSASDVYVRFYGPSHSNTSSNQTIEVVFKAGAPPGYLYNQSGDFYYRSAGPVAEGPLTDWSSAHDSPLPSSLWQYMTDTTVGWKTYSSYSNTALGGYLLVSANCTNCTVTTTGTCPLCNTPYVRSQTGGTNVSLDQTVSDCVTNNTVQTQDSYTMYYGIVLNSTGGQSTIYGPKQWACADTKSYLWSIMSGTKSSHYVVGCPKCSYIYSYNMGGLLDVSETLISAIIPINTVAYSRIVILD